jgi:hypothetical protein
MAKFKTKTYIYNLSKFPAIYPEHSAPKYNSPNAKTGR